MTSVDLLLATLAIICGSIIQGISGVGGGFISVPLLAMIDISLLPGAFMFGSLSLSGLMAWNEKSHIDFANTSTLLIALLPGALLGGWLLSSVSVEHIGLVFGSAILIAVLISAAGIHLPLNKMTAAISGFIAGTMGASSGIGAPVVAVLYQREPGPRVRATLAYVYTVASALIVLALAVFGRFDTGDAQTGLLLVPGFLFGYLCSRPLALRFDLGATRYIVLTVSALAAVMLVVTSI